MKAMTSGTDNDAPLFYPSGMLLSVLSGIHVAESLMVLVDDDAPMTQTQDSPVKGEKAASLVNLASALAGLLG